MVSDGLAGMHALRHVSKTKVAVQALQNAANGQPPTHSENRLDLCYYDRWQ